MIAAVAFDFEDKECVSIDPNALEEHRAQGEYCWLEIGEEAFEQASHWLQLLGVNTATVNRIAADEQVGHFHVGRRWIDFSIVEARFSDDEFVLGSLHVVVGDGFMVTIHKSGSPTVAGVLETYEDDFAAAAQSAGFLLFEVADHLIAGYRSALGELATRVEDVQTELIGDAGDDILAEVSGLTRSLLDYRKSVVSAREIIHELGTRRSKYVQPSTQPFLEKQTLPLERLAADAATERTVLSESLSLYMGIVSHRTNRVVNRLTIVSMIFLPLSFLAALYGMNFDHMPELHWRFGYMGFWVVAIVLVVSLLAYMKRKQWI